MLVVSTELLSIRKYRKENEWGKKKVVKRDAIFLKLDLLGDHQWLSSSSFAACELFWRLNSCMRINYSFFFFFFYDVFLLFSSPSLNRRISLSSACFTKIKRILKITIFFKRLSSSHMLYVYIAKATDYYHWCIRVGYQSSI